MLCSGSAWRFVNVGSHRIPLASASEAAPQPKCQKCRRHGIRWTTLLNFFFFGRRRAKKGFPYIASVQAANHLGHELVEEITAEGFVVVPVEEFLWLHQKCGSHLSCQLNEQSVYSPIASLPSPLWRHALSQWNPNPDNPFAARKSPKTPPAETKTVQELLSLDRAQDTGNSSRLAQSP